MNKIVVYANDVSSVKELSSAAKGFGAEVVLITSGSEYGCADEVLSYCADVSVASVVADIAKAAAGADMLLCQSGRDGKLVAAYCAALMGTSPLCDVTSVKLKDDGVVTERLVYGGSAIKTQKSGFPAVLIVNPGVFEASDADAQAVVSELALNENPNVVMTETCAVQASSVNLAGAKRVTAAGRGLVSQDNIPAFEKLASAIGAEIGCTRPVAEEEHWYPKDRYIGVSGCMLKPNFYMAVGVSGQIQHMVGVNQSKVIFAIDKNENAPIVSQADYVLIGDTAAVLPALADMLT